jgi:NADP-dependent 3-hydroxy acid dehydrogenase YdfG
LVSHPSGPDVPGSARPVTSLAGRGALVTGASKGIGRAVALALAGVGAAVVATGRDAAGLGGLAAEAAANGTPVHTHPAELTDGTGIKQLAASAHDLVGDVAVLVHSAGTYRRGPFADADLADFDRQYEVNVRAPYALTQLLLPDLIRSNGDVVFVNSTQGLAATAQVGQYAATKHALRAVADSLRGELGSSGPRVCTISPGRTATPLQRSIFEAEGREWRPEEILAPEDVAALVLAVVTLPLRAEVTDIVVRPSRKV